MATAAEADDWTPSPPSKRDSPSQVSGAPSSTRPTPTRKARVIAWSKRNRQARAKIRKRRDVQFETFKFAQKRLSDNRDALQQLDRRVRETNRLGLAKRRQIDDEAASMAAQQAQEMLIIDAAARASEEERRLLRDLLRNAKVYMQSLSRRTRSAKIWKGSGAGNGRALP